MKSKFFDWWKNVSDDYGNEVVPLNKVNYVWINNIINKKSELRNPSVEEIFEWIKSEQIDAVRR